jgi:hypothetical protein
MIGNLAIAVDNILGKILVVIHKYSRVGGLKMETG